MLQGVQRMTGDVLYTSERLSQDNQDLAQCTEGQAMALEQVSSINDMSSSLMDSSSNPTEVDILTSKTLDSVKRGEGLIEKMQRFMEGMVMKVLLRM